MVHLPVNKVVPLTAAIGRPFVGHKSPAARELFKPSTDSASLLVQGFPNFFVLQPHFQKVFFWATLDG